MTQTPEPAESIDIPGYEVASLIGCGGMGCVYCARQESLGRDVALKMLQPGPEEGRAERLQCFRSEAHTLAALSHPNIVAVFDRGESDRGAFICMELVEGGCLRDRLKTGLKMSPGSVFKILRPVVAALSHMHSHGVLHRDLKPENILFDADGTPKVADFGLAALAPELDTATSSAGWSGSLNYMSPEQRQKLPVDKRADVYALAVIAYEMLTGELPLGVFEPPSVHDPGLNREVDAVFENALRRDPDERCSSVDEFLKGMKLAFRNDAESAATVASAAAAPSRSKLGALAVVLLLVASAFLFSSNKKEQPELRAGETALSQSKPVDPRPTQPAISDINQATLAELLESEGIGEVLARRIIRERDSRGGFESFDEVMEVDGIGLQRWQSLKERFNVIKNDQNGK